MKNEKFRLFGQSQARHESCQNDSHSDSGGVNFVHSVVSLSALQRDFPALRRSSFFRWSMMLAQLNSVFNPVLYCYRDRRFRDAFLEILKLKKPALNAQRKLRKVDFVHTLDAGPSRTPRDVPRSEIKQLQLHNRPQPQ